MPKKQDTSTPLQKLIAQNNELYGKRVRPKSAKPVKPPLKLERAYSAAMRKIINELAVQIKSEITPLLKEHKAEYTADGFTDDIRAIFQRLSAFLFGEKLFEDIAFNLVNDIDESATGDVTKRVNEAIGVDYSYMINREGLSEFKSLAIEENAKLIKNLSQDYLERSQTIINEGIMGGQRPGAIAKQLSEQIGVADRRAKLIARDQVSKINSDITRRRFDSIGVTHFRWVTSKDERVSGKPSGKYPNAKISCYDIARKKNPEGVGVYSLSEGATYAGETRLYPGRAHIGCRCTSSPVFDYELEK